jgi:hypothetical protein
VQLFFVQVYTHLNRAVLLVAFAVQAPLAGRATAASRCLRAVARSLITAASDAPTILAAPAVQQPAMAVEALRSRHAVCAVAARHFAARASRRSAVYVSAGGPFAPDATAG